MNLKSLLLVLSNIVASLSVHPRQTAGVFFVGYDDILKIGNYGLTLPKIENIISLSWRDNKKPRPPFSRAFKKY